MAGTPDVLSSPPASPARRRLAFGLALAVAVTAAALAASGSSEDDPDQAAAPTATSSSAPPADRTGSTRTTIDPSDRVTGSHAVSSAVPNGATAIEAAQAVADSYCERISSWRLTIDGADGEYLRVVVLLRPAGPAYRDVALHIELTWDVDHYDWAASRTALESCP